MNLRSYCSVTVIVGILLALVGSATRRAFAASVDASDASAADAALGCAGVPVVPERLYAYDEDPECSCRSENTCRGLTAPRAEISAPCGPGLYATRGGGKVGEAANAIERCLGPNAKGITNKAGDTVHVSEDGLRRIRFDLNKPHPHESPHSHVEEFINGKWEKSGPIYPTDVPAR